MMNEEIFKNLLVKQIELLGEIKENLIYGNKLTELLINTIESMKGSANKEGLKKQLKSLKSVFNSENPKEDLEKILVGVLENLEL